MPEAVGCSRTIIQKGDALVVGTTRNMIISGERLETAVTVTQGHYGEMWGLAEQRASNGVITCAYDNTVKLWDVGERRPVWTIELKVTIKFKLCLFDRLVSSCHPIFPPTY